ncbi:MAG: hypothetical protein H0U87_08085, partial [Acidobacteria bacterium]|nr:hypothetical protein [Acidobacteriota bacterium]
MQNAQAIGNAGDVQSPEATEPQLNYLNNGFSLKSWLLTKDHKRIAILYLLSV